MYPDNLFPSLRRVSLNCVLFGREIKTRIAASFLSPKGSSQARLQSSGLGSATLSSSLTVISVVHFFFCRQACARARIRTHTSCSAADVWIQFAFPQSALYLCLISCVEVERLNNGRVRARARAQAFARRRWTSTMGVAIRSKRSTNNNNLFRCFSCALPSDRVNSPASSLAERGFLGILSSATSAREGD